MLFNEDSIRAPRRVFRGVAYIKGTEKINKPFEFTYKNFYPLEEQQQILRAVLFPESIDSSRRFALTSADRKFVMQYMSQLPRETKFPAYYKDKNYYDAYCKFFMYG